MRSVSQIEVVPAILVKSEEELAERALRVVGLARWVHYDVMDGDFVPNKTFSDPLVVCAQLALFDVEAHLMVLDPASDFGAWCRAGVKRLLFHTESVHDLEAAVVEAKGHGAEVGVAINPSTDIRVLAPVLSKLDMVLVMGVEPGFSGQPHDPRTPSRVRWVREQHSTIPIEVDGGVDDRTAPALIRAGATILAAAGYLFKSRDIRAAIQRLRTS